jgi:hypothetical protein
MPQSTVLAISPEEQTEMMAALRRARYGYLLALHIFYHSKDHTYRDVNLNGL